MDVYVSVLHVPRVANLEIVLEKDEEASKEDLEDDLEEEMGVFH